MEAACCRPPPAPSCSPVRARDSMPRPARPRSPSRWGGSLMCGTGTGELLLLLIVGRIVLGPERMPKLARDLGRAVAEFRKTSDELRGEFLNADKYLEAPPAPAAIAPVTPVTTAVPVAEGTTTATDAT